MSFPLENARLCMDCDTVFDAPICPSCSSESFFPLSRWIRPALDEIRSEGTRPARQEVLVQTVAQQGAQSRGRAARNASLLLAGGGLAYAAWRAFMSKGKGADRVEEIARRGGPAKPRTGSRSDGS